MAGPLTNELRGPRRRLVETLRANGIVEAEILRAFDEVPRHLFVPTGVRHRAYEDAPLPIGSGQTISQPYIHARYLQVLALAGSERVLEVGTGSGYQTALLARMAEQIFTIERIPALLERAREILQQIGVRNVSFLLGDGSVGWRDYAPYDAILVGAAAPEVPRPLVEQLADGGRMLIPLGDREEQVLALVTRRGDEVERCELAPVRFVPLLGSHGWDV